MHFFDFVRRTDNSVNVHVSSRKETVILGLNGLVAHSERGGDKPEKYFQLHSSARLGVSFHTGLYMPSFCSYVCPLMNDEAKRFVIICNILQHHIHFCLHTFTQDETGWDAEFAWLYPFIHLNRATLINVVSWYICIMIHMCDFMHCAAIIIHLKRAKLKFANSAERLNNIQYLIYWSAFIHFSWLFEWCTMEKNKLPDQERFKVINGC